MLIPQFSIRWLLAITALCAGALSVVALAIRGSRWAQAVSVGIGTLVSAMLVYAAAFGVVWLCAAVIARSGRYARVQDPFGPPRPPGADVRSGPAETPATPILLE